MKYVRSEQSLPRSSGNISDLYPLGMRRLLLFACLLAIPAIAQASPKQLTAAAKQLQRDYNKTTGLYSTAGWWNSANSITTLADLSLTLHTRRYFPVFENTLVQAPKKFPGFLNEFYDDEGWWALAWIRVYDVTKDEKYLKTSEAIFQDMTTGWDETCDGGIWWSKKRAYKNAIANELFFSVATSLALRTQGAPQAAYRDWAEREWKWFRQTGMINSDHLINDGLTKECKNNGKTTWTYNQGVILGALAGFAALNHDATAISTANTITSATLVHLVDPAGVLHDPCEPNCGEDGIQFKGIFVRNLSDLPISQTYRDALQRNSQSLWEKAQGPKTAFDERWSGPYTHTNAGIQSSALDLLIATRKAEQGRPPKP
ncbi:glycoside hydrolase family 76 [Terriglobus saanensis SP1PR4]|uniref:Glycoside hydrolase family 76 n=1 Tax=Terriglobus saanensis (strain ATCC BAA-1853 / DSM 23119 / SP1PR4) TaxID=401053 RepID=E8UZ71_TERSS|nr:glycoside hydrolase family 76 [Terriglobus saanensis SP1PR4]